MRQFEGAMQWLAIGIWGIGLFAFLILMWTTPPWVLRHWFRAKNPEPVERDLDIGAIHFRERPSPLPPEEQK